MSNLLDKAARADAAFTRAVVAALPALAGEHPAARRGYLSSLLRRTAEEAAANVGGTIPQQRAIRTAHRKAHAVGAALARSL